jgi:hypothetical protein
MAPTSRRVADHPEEAEQFYQDLKNLYNHHSSSSLLVICGDFNSKLGKQQFSDEQFLGHFGKGSRNSNGVLLAEFMIMNGLFATNTNFRHSARHISSWHGCINDHLYHSQIDYILCKQHYKSLFTDSRTHNGTITNSDHSVVISTLQLSKYYTISSDRHKINNTYDTKARKFLTTHPEKREELKNSIDNSLSHFTHEQHELEWHTVVRALKAAIRKVVPSSKLLSAVRTERPVNDEQLQQLSEQQRDLRLRIYNDNTITSHQRNQLRRQQRQQIFHNIRSIKKIQYNQYLDHLAEEINASPSDSRRCFEAMRAFIRKQYQQFTLHDNNHNIVHNPTILCNLVADHFEQSFQAVTSPPASTPQLFQGPIHQPISEPEVQVAVHSLKSGRASDSSGMYGELFKWAGAMLVNLLTSTLNNIFEFNRPIYSLCSGILIPSLNKAGKECVLSNVRPIVIVSIIRKVFATVTLNRVYLKLSVFVSPNQSGFQRGRSTADIVWLYRWLDAMCQRYAFVVEMLGIDMSKAFDSISRELLLQVLSNLLNDDEMRLVHVLLTDVRLKVRVDRAFSRIFKTGKGVPQGDSLSPLFFIVYLEAALREFRQFMSVSSVNSTGPSVLSFDTAYADDVDFGESNKAVIDFIRQECPQVFKKWFLVINDSKTEQHQFKQGSVCTVKKLGSIIDPSQTSSGACNCSSWRSRIYGSCGSEINRCR